ncbi:MAG: efflux RND transporter permease subunit [Blastocatellia bacterium]|nr:efflux RND transporter permease subunit [Blastocatellia bacterium]
MQKLAEICIKRPVFAAMIILALVVIGASSYFKLGVDRFPAVDVPTVTVRATLPGASPEEAEATLAQTLEEAVNTVEGIEQLRSVSSQGRTFVTATFGLDRDIDNAAQDVRDRVQGVTRLLPPGTDPPIVQKFDNERQGILTIALSSNRSVRELSELADNIVRKQLERSSGVGEITIAGGITRSINVWVDADRLAAYGIPITDVRAAVVRQNADVPGGNVDNGRRELSLRTMGRVVDPGLFNDLVIKTIGGAPVRVRDIGYAEDGTKEQRSISRLTDLTAAGDDLQKRAETPGVPSVTVEVRRQTGANTMAVIEDVKKNMSRLQAQLPSDVKLEIISDQSRYIENALHEINIHLILGSVLACLVVLIFMRSWRSTIIAGIAIPTSVVSTFGMMKALDFTLNSVTMLALVLMVGVVIDDAIVVLENIFRFIEEKKMHPMQAAREATREIGLAVLATTLSLVVIFLPISFMSSISGRFLYQFGITAAVAIMVSLLVSFTLTPMMSARLIHVSDAHNDGREDSAASRRGFYGYIDRAYTWMLHFVMRRRLLVGSLALLVMASSIPLYKLVRQDFIPSNIDEAEFSVNLTAPEGTSLVSMNEALEAVEAELKQMPEVRMLLGRAGSSFLGSLNSAEVYVRIPPHEERTINLTKFWKGLTRGEPLAVFRGNYSARDVQQKARQRLRKFTHLRPAVRNPQTINLGGGGFTDVDFVLRGPDLTTLVKYANELRDRSPELGLLDADVTLKIDKPELRVNIDRSRAADLGVDSTDIATALGIMVGGDERVSRFHDAQMNEDYDVQVRLKQGDRNDAETISRLFVPSSRGALVNLANLVSVKLEDTSSRIDRLDRQRQVSLRANIAPGYALADRLQALRDESAKLNMPAGYNTAISGRASELERTGAEFIVAFLLSIAFMYMILASQFESVIHPITILLSLPLAVPFALISMWAMNDTLNLYSALGVLVLFGVVKKNSILQIDHMNGLRERGMSRYDAIIQANRDRLRPILMTTLALVAGMLPLALGTGPGAEERRTIAIVVIGGQSLSLLLTLLITPVAYSIFDDIDAWIRRRASTKQPIIKSGPLESLKNPDLVPASDEAPKVSAARSEAGD